MSQALSHPELISLAAGFVDQMTLPGELVQISVERLLASPEDARSALQYGTTPGVPGLRDLILQRLLTQDGANTGVEAPSIDQVVVTSGSNQLIHLVLESLLDPGDIVLCAAPTYLVFLGVVSQLGARAVGVPIDAEGMIPSALVEVFEQLDRQGEKDRVKAIYLVPYADNPSGITMPLQRSAEIMEISREWSNKQLPIQLIADLAYRDLRYSEDDIPSIRTLDPRGDQVILTGTFSKSFSPGIRVGWGLLPMHLVSPVCDQKGNIDFGSPNFNQYLMLDILKHGLLDSHLQKICHQYEVKLSAMLTASERWFSDLEGVTWRSPGGGLYVWMEVPKQIDTGPQGALFKAASQEGVLYVAGEYCYAAEGEPIHRNTMRLSFGVQPPDKIEQGMKSLSRALKSVIESVN